MPKPEVVTQQQQSKNVIQSCIGQLKTLLSACQQSWLMIACQAQLLSSKDVTAAVTLYIRQIQTLSTVIPQQLDGALTLAAGIQQLPEGGSKADVLPLRRLLLSQHPLGQPVPEFV